MTQLWWDRFPERLKWELEALEAAGIPARRDEESFAAGLARLIVEPTIDGTKHEFVVTFPDLYPYFRFDIEAKHVALEHHQEPFGNRLCMIGRATENWRVSDSVASMLTEQVPKVLVAGQAKDKDAGGVAEERQGEPFSDYYTYLPFSMVMIDGSWRIDPAVQSGSFILRYHPNPPKHDPLFVVRGVVERIFSDSGVELARVDPAVLEQFPLELKGRWVRSNAAIRTNDPAMFFDAIQKLDPKPHRAQSGAVDGKEMFIRAVVFPEEHAHRENADGWMFAVQLLGEQKKRGQREVFSYLARTGRAGRGDMIERAPELRGLADKSIAIFGLGCIGAPSALEFARAGVGKLSLVDGDHVDPGTALRWPFGWAAAGLPKPHYLKAVIAGNYPYTAVDPIAAVIGAPRAHWKDSRNDMELVDQAIDGTSLIFDATAEIGVQYFLSDVARERDLPYICVAGKQGGWGGYVLRIIPGRTEGCWLCFQNRLGEDIPIPPAAPTGFIQPAGCANPTFLAAGFDMTHMATHAVRMAVGYLTPPTGDGGYPDGDWDVLVIETRDADGRAIAPASRPFQLRKHPNCPRCNPA